MTTADKTSAATVVSLTLCKEQAYAAERVVLFKEVVWPSIPPEGALLQHGISENGEESGASCEIRRVWFAANGGTSVEAEMDNLREEFDTIVADAKRDGFLEYDEWKASRGDA